MKGFISLTQRREDSFDSFLSVLSKVCTVLAVLCAFACVGHEVILRIVR